MHLGRLFRFAAGVSLQVCTMGVFRVAGKNIVVAGRCLGWSAGRILGWSAGSCLGLPGGRRLGWSVGRCLGCLAGR